MAPTPREPRFSASATSDVPLLLDPNAQPGDTIVVQAFAWAGGGVSPSLGEGWTQLVTGPSTGIRNAIWALRWDGDPLADWITGGTGGAYLISVPWTDVHDDILDAPPPTPTASSAATATAPSTPVTTPGAAVVHFWTVNDNDGISNPSEGTLLYGGPDFLTGTGNDGAAGAAWRLAAEPGPSGTCTASVANSNYCVASTIALKPATVAPVPPTVSVGDDTSVVHGEPLQLTADETPNTAPIHTRAWTVTAGPAGVGTVLSSTAGLDWSPTLPAWPGASYTVRYDATSDAGVGSDELVVEIIDPTVPRWRANLEVDGFGGFKTGTEYDREPNGVMQLVSSPVRDGTVAMRAGIVEPAQRVTGQQRSEHSPDGAEFREDDEAWFGISMWLPAEFDLSPDGFLVFQQWKNNGPGSPPIALEIDDGRIVLACHYSGGQQAQRFDLGPAVREQWIDLATRVRFSTTPAVGEVEVWRNGALVLPTANPAGGTLYPRDLIFSYVKLGFYGNSSSPDQYRVLVLDAMAWGLTRASVTPPAPVSAGSPAWLAFFPDRMVTL